ncbi:MAG: aspartyl protease family protein [Candidatus Sulfotelmatobacter sp.]
MRFLILICMLLALGNAARAQEKTTPSQETKSATVPAAIDHNRVIINADVPLPDGSIKTIHAWVDNGNPDLYMSRRLATLLGLAVTCGEKECSAPAPAQIMVGGMTIRLSAIKEAKIPLKPVAGEAVMAGGMNAEINIPSSVLRHYDVLIDFPGHKFSIGSPGTIHFQGSSEKVQINAENGLIQVQSKLENKKYNLALDLGSSISFLSGELFERLATAHPDWPHMTGAVGSANAWGAEEEAKWQVMRVDRVQFGPLFLTNLAVVELPTSVSFIMKPTGESNVGVLGSNVLLNYRVGLDYTHSMVYFDIGRMFNFPEFDVIGLVLRPEDDGRYTIVGVADFEGKPSVPSGADEIRPGDHLVAVDGIPVRGSTMGQVWLMLGGTPGQERSLTIERGGKDLTIAANIQHFLGEVPDERQGKKKK